MRSTETPFDWNAFDVRAFVNACGAHISVDWNVVSYIVCCWLDAYMQSIGTLSGIENPCVCARSRSYTSLPIASPKWVKNARVATMNRCFFPFHRFSNTMHCILNADSTLRTIQKWLDCVGAMCVQLAFHIVYVVWDFVWVRFHVSGFFFWP